MLTFKAILLLTTAAVTVVNVQGESCTFKMGLGSASRENGHGSTESKELCEAKVLQCDPSANGAAWVQTGSGSCYGLVEMTYLDEAMDGYVTCELIRPDESCVGDSYLWRFPEETKDKDDACTAEWGGKCWNEITQLCEPVSAKANSGPTQDDQEGCKGDDQEGDDQEGDDQEGDDQEGDDQECVDFVPATLNNWGTWSWLDSNDFECETYADYGICNKDGSDGRNILMLSGGIAAAAVNGVSATEACCGCGGGTKSGSHAGSDAGSHAGSDAGSHAGSDAGSHAGSDAGPSVQYTDNSCALSTSTAFCSPCNPNGGCASLKRDCAIFDSKLDYNCCLDGKADCNEVLVETGPAPSEDQECASKLFKTYSDDTFQVGTKSEAKALIATIKKAYKAIKADYRAAKKNLKRLKRAL